MFLFACARWLIVTTHGSTPLSRYLFLLDSLTERSSHRACISIVNHALSMCLRADPKLILVSAMSPIHIRVFSALILSNRSHKVIILRDYPLIRRLSLLLRQLRLALDPWVTVLRLHVFAYYLVFRKLLLWDLLGLRLVSVERAVVRVETHAHVVQGYLGLVENFVIR